MAHHQKLQESFRSSEVGAAFLPTSPCAPSPLNWSAAADERPLLGGSGGKVLSIHLQTAEPPKLTQLDGRAALHRRSGRAAPRGDGAAGAAREWGTAGHSSVAPAAWGGTLREPSAPLLSLLPPEARGIAFRLRREGGKPRRCITYAYLCVYFRCREHRKRGKALRFPPFPVPPPPPLCYGRKIRQDLSECRKIAVGT